MIDQVILNNQTQNTKTTVTAEMHNNWAISYGNSPVRNLIPQVFPDAWQVVAMLCQSPYVEKYDRFTITIEGVG